MQYSDEYFNNCRKIVERYSELISRQVRYPFFARESGIVVGSNKSVNFIRDSTYGPLRIYGCKDGEPFISKQPVLTVEGTFRELVNLETTTLGNLSFSGAASSMKKIVNAANGVPVIDMSARHYPWQIIEETSLAAYLGGAAGTSTQGGYNYVQKWHNPGDNFKLYASLPHALAALVAETAEKEKLFPSVAAAKLFKETFPGKPITVLVDYEGKELEVAKQALEIFGDQLFAVRLDTNSGRQMQGTYSLPKPNTHEIPQRLGLYFQQQTGHHLKNLLSDFCKIKNRDTLTINEDQALKYYIGKGVTIEATYVMRQYLNSIKANNVKIIVSSGFNEEKTSAFVHAEAPMDFIGTGSWIKFLMFTTDISHVLENGIWVPRTKAGRTHGKQSEQILFERK
jgi:nicotinate phosphoribosyltransferase